MSDGHRKRTVEEIMAGPRGGDVALGCEHQPIAPASPDEERMPDAHWYWVDPLECSRPDVGPRIAQWVFVCDACEVKFGHRMHDALAKGEVKLATMIECQPGIAFHPVSPS